MKKILFSGIALVAFSAFILPAAPAQSGSAVQAGTSATSVSGKITTQTGKYFITDDTTQTTFEIRGEKLQRWVGQKACVSGQVSEGMGGQPQVITLSHIDRLGAAATAGGSKAAAAGVKAGLSKGAVAGIVAGGATAATVGSLYATDVIGGDDTPVSRP